ncbi:hypothetical protein [Weissella soli]|uniref:Uncharacterized protein n=1 Tax=Weissella soli TaxID=155866 RepID=A0A288Q6I1_9LACO|nr:hypothetical protein [Weissella soli]AOT56597.1 hypothetical protein WSWS_00966 [Weissella soli]NKY83049.1 hypothetical protein [Weissella soli]RDL12162.1 hypothetical protein DFP99_0595 [Weissella soli]GEN92601.1 hypothetical protein WSO01_02130 [Weissella soli]
MEKFDFKKILIIFLIAITLIVTTYNVIHAIVNQMAPNYLELFSLAPVLIALYNESDFIYRWVNKLKAYIKNSTVVFEPSVRLELADEIQLLDVEEVLISFMDKENLSKKRDIEKRESSLSIKTATSNKLRFTINANLVNKPTNQQLVLKFEYQIAARSVKSVWSDFKKYKDFITSKFTFNDCSYTLGIDLNSSNLNPFYKITIKTIQPIKIKSVQIDIKNDEMTLKIQKNKIYATSSDLETLEDIVKNYIPLTNVY